MSSPDSYTADWIQKFNRALSAKSEDALTTLFLDDSHWRNILGLGWTLKTTSSRDSLCKELLTAAIESSARDFVIDNDQLAPQKIERAGQMVTECAIKYQTRSGPGTGVLRLVERDHGDWVAWSLMTALDNPAPDPAATKPESGWYLRDWKEQREEQQAYGDRDPQVLVVGGGHAGLCAAVELGQRGIDTLVVDRFDRVGDNWRKRYGALSLHNRTPSNHLPYLPFPSTFPRYIPKDKIANWLESYAEIMELNVWCQTSLKQARYDGKRNAWTATVTLANGSTRELHPQHIVMATSVSGKPKRASIPGLEDFTGEIVHSSEFTSSETWRNKNVVVFGTGTSAHDIVQDLHLHGANVTMVQRGTTMITNLEPSAQLYDQIYYDEGPALEVRDLINTSFPLALIKKSHQALTAKAREIDAPLLEGLEKVGFKLEFGDDDTGWPLKYRKRGGGYYFNSGCSEFIASGDVKLIQYSDVNQIDKVGVLMKEGHSVPADLIVLATGYHTQDQLLRELFDEDVADRVGPVWGFNDITQELRNMWCATPQPGLWFTGGSFSQCRMYSKYLAMQIEADAAAS